MTMSFINTPYNIKQKSLATGKKNKAGMRRANEEDSASMEHVYRNSGYISYVRLIFPIKLNTIPKIPCTMVYRMFDESPVSSACSCKWLWNVCGASCYYKTLNLNIYI